MFYFLVTPFGEWGGASRASRSQNRLDTLDLDAHYYSVHESTAPRSDTSDYESRSTSQSGRLGDLEAEHVWLIFEISLIGAWLPKVPG